MSRVRIPACPLHVNALDALYLPLAIATAPLWARKQRRDWPERLGRIDPVPSAQPPRPRLLLHAVSVGETNAIRELVPLLAPHVHPIVSVGTDTGIARARELFDPPAGSGRPRLADVVRYPLDFSWSVARFLDATRPDAVALVELELWPNFVRACEQRGIPIAIINGRLSERSFKGYRRLRWFFRRSFGRLTFAAVQDETYAKRFREMGLPADRCLVTGSMKWDTARIEDDAPGSAALARELGIERGPGTPPLVVGGSTAEGEEAMLHAACAGLGDVQLLCAPRKPERFDEAALALPGCVRRSARRPAPPGTRRFLLDTIGELRAAYALADVVVMGRTFAPLRGSDPIEPVSLGKPTIIGPSMDNFEEIRRLLVEGGGVVQTTRDGLAAEIGSLLASPDRRATLATRGRGIIRAQQGATARHADLLRVLAERRFGKISASRSAPAAP